ncbi:hypothetical protein [Tepidibacter formicigenes]|uniref:Uncharacterized protein n=1 Tax=Tepidibacter formicigenes DSM 15518 TaxID=1123349 RepID=A0A1M6NRV2_9FIRM|nr:hypothetical protein [Tepidibacter formicigenes]SHJ98441.1 hypothetical protein SAMN02744037_01345 [Tepidibacter formicigenes DSM 15518]
MDKRVIKSILLIGALIFIISFFITSFKTKDSSDESKEAINTKEVSLINELKKQKSIQISNKNLEDIDVEEEFYTDFKYYLGKLNKLDNSVEFNEVFTGKGDNIEFSTDFNYIKVTGYNKIDYFEIPSNEKEGIRNLFNKEIYTSFDSIKNYKNWDNVIAEYKDKKKEISNLKEFDEKIIKKRKISQYQASKMEEQVKDNFYITINAKEYEFYIQTIGKNAIGVYYKNYKSYYEIDNDFYNYLCDISFVAKKDNEIEQEKSEYDWVQSIEIKDIVNNIDETFDGEQKDNILDSLFNKEIKEVNFDKYEVKRYILKLKGNGKSEDITIYESYVYKNDKYYEIKNADLIIDSFLNAP